MKTIIKKSILASLCAFALLISALPALAMETDTKKIEHLKKTSTLANQQIQKFAQLCYTTMSQNFSDKPCYNKLDRKTIDAFVTTNQSLNVYISGPHPFNVTGIRASCGIFVGFSPWYLPQEKHSTTDISSHQKNIICHEVACVWLGHQLQPELSPQQKRFDAENLAIQTLSALEEQEAILASFSTRPCFYNNKSTVDAHLLGAINGVVQTKNEALYNKVTSCCSKNKTFILGLKEEKAVTTLLHYWKTPVNNYNQAQKYARYLLNTRNKIVRHINLENLSIGLGVFYLYYKFFR
jgi:hypothetical protein